MFSLHSASRSVSRFVARIAPSPLVAFTCIVAPVAVCVACVACGVERDDDACARVPSFHDVAAFPQSCDRCHASTLMGPRRQGAPVDVNFDTYEAAVASARASVDEVETNGMPPDAPLALDEKTALMSWLRCGTPE